MLHLQTKIKKIQNMLYYLEKLKNQASQIIYLIIMHGLTLIFLALLWFMVEGEQEKVTH